MAQAATTFGCTSGCIAPAGVEAVLSNLDPLDQRRLEVADLAAEVRLDVRERIAEVKRTRPSCRLDPQGGHSWPSRSVSGVKAREQSTWWLPQSGLIIGIGWSTEVVPEAFADGRISLDADVSDCRILEHGDGGLLIDPDVFTGSVYINIVATPS